MCIRDSLYVDRDGALLVSDFDAARPVARFDPSSNAGEGIRFETMEGSGPATALARSTTGELWMGRDKGAFLLGHPDEAVKEIGVVGLAEPGLDGVMWFGVNDEKSDSIWRYEPSSAQGGTASWTEFTDANGLPTGPKTAVRALLTLADGSLLAATMSGARRFDGKQFVPWPRDLPRLQTVRVYHAARDAEGGIWLATAEGVFHTDGATWSKLDMRDGLPENTINRVHRAADGRVWMGGWNKGLARYRPSKSASIAGSSSKVRATTRRLLQTGSRPEPLRSWSRPSRGAARGRWLCSSSTAISTTRSPRSRHSTSRCPG